MALNKINLQIRLPSVGLKEFIQRALTDEDFFRMALENPAGAFKAVGLSLVEEDFIPADLAAFFGILGRLREVVGKEGLAKATFERIFGQPPVYYGATFKAQLNQGFLRDWGGQQAATNKQSCFSTAKGFAQDAGTGRGIGASQDTCESRAISVNASIVGETETQNFRNHHTERMWNNHTEIATTKEVGLSRATSEDFKKSGVGTEANFLHGPLIHPTDLAAVTGRLEAFAAAASADKKD